MNFFRHGHRNKWLLLWLLVCSILIFCCAPAALAAAQTTQGTDYILQHDPSTNTSTLYVNTGQMIVTSSISGKMITAQAGQKISIDSKGNIQIESFTPTTWNNLKQDVGVVETPTQKTPLTTIIPILALICFIGFRIRKK